MQFTGKYIYGKLKSLYEEQKELLDALNELEDSSSVYPNVLTHLEGLWNKKKKETTDFENKIFQGE